MTASGTGPCKTPSFGTAGLTVSRGLMWSRPSGGGARAAESNVKAQCEPHSDVEQWSCVASPRTRCHWNKFRPLIHTQGSISKPLSYFVLISSTRSTKPVLRRLVSLLMVQPHANSNQTSQGICGMKLHFGQRMKSDISPARPPCTVFDLRWITAQSNFVKLACVKHPQANDVSIITKRISY